MTLSGGGLVDKNLLTAEIKNYTNNDINIKNNNNNNYNYNKLVDHTCLCFVSVSSPGSISSYAGIVKGHNPGTMSGITYS